MCSLPNVLVIAQFIEASFWVSETNVAVMTNCKRAAKTYVRIRPLVDNLAATMAYQTKRLL